jgi:hypothetical protein
MPKSEPDEFGTIFRRLRAILETHAGALTVTADTSKKYCLEGEIGPATLQAWSGRVRRPRIAVAWVELGKASVSYHLMALSIPSVQAGMSKALKARMHGKTCFNFTVSNPALFTELDALTAASIAAFEKSGFVS